MQNWISSKAVMEDGRTQRDPEPDPGIQDTRKITNAMYLISSTKLKKARKELAETEPYFYALQNVIRRIQRHLPNMESPYFEKEGHQSKKTGLLVISGDKRAGGCL